MKVHITEYLDVDLVTERWCCHACGETLNSARQNYKEACLVAEVPWDEVYPRLAESDGYSFQPNQAYCRLLEFYCPGCGVTIENEYLPPGHPITHEIEPDIDALKRRYCVT